MQVKIENGERRDVSLMNVTPENFIVPQGEEHLYHCKIEVRKFNVETGERLSKPRIQVFGKKFFETFGFHNLRKQGYAVEVLHDPTEWIAANKEKLESMKKAKAEEARKAEREAIKAELLEELRMSGVIPSDVIPSDDMKKKKQPPQKETKADEAKDNKQ